MELAPGTRIIATYTNAEDGVAAVLADIGTGISLVVKDLDSGLALPMARLYAYAEAEKADAYARQIGGAAQGPATSAAARLRA